jgi:hypothetical protein
MGDGAARPAWRSQEAEDVDQSQSKALDPAGWNGEVPAEHRTRRTHLDGHFHRHDLALSDVLADHGAEG